jgi:hypothetical protein
MEEVRVDLRIGRTAAIAVGAQLLAACEREAANPPQRQPAQTGAQAPSVVDTGSGIDAEPRADAEQELVRLEHAYAQALMRKDRAFLMRYYATDWRGGNWMGFWTKSTMLKAVLDERYVVKSMTLRDLKTRVVGRIGIVQGVDDEVTSVDGKDTSGKWSFTDIFEYRNGQWVAIASHTAEVKPAQ